MAVGKQVVQKMQYDLSITHDSAVNSHNCFNTDDESQKNCEIILLGGWDKRKCAWMCWWRLRKRKVNPHVSGGNSRDNA